MLSLRAVATKNSDGRKSKIVYFICLAAAAATEASLIKVSRIQGGPRAGSVPRSIRSLQTVSGRDGGAWPRCRPGHWRAPARSVPRWSGDGRYGSGCQRQPSVGRRRFIFRASRACAAPRDSIRPLSISFRAE